LRAVHGARPANNPARQFFAWRKAEGKFLGEAVARLMTAQANIARFEKLGE
jgi:hypothetical protein